jgi:hypothetical protein
VRLVVEIHEEVAGLLGGPRAGWMLGDSEDADAPGGVLDYGQDMAWVPSSRSAVRKPRQDRVGLRAQELRPRWPGPLQRGADAGILQNLPRCRRAMFTPRPASSP